MFVAGCCAVGMVFSSCRGLLRAVIALYLPCSLRCAFQERPGCPAVAPAPPVEELPAAVELPGRERCSERRARPAAEHAREAVIAARVPAPRFAERGPRSLGLGVEERGLR